MNQQQRAVMQQVIDALFARHPFTYSEEITALRQLLEQPEPVQEPDIFPDEAYEMGLERIAYYTTPPAQPAAWVWLKDDELIAAYRRGRDSVPKPTNGWCFVDDHIPGLREVQREVLYTLREKNGGAA